MPAMKCSNGKWKWGERGKCVFPTKAAAEKAARAIWAERGRAAKAAKRKWR